MSGSCNETGKAYSQELLEAAINLVKSGQVGLKQASRDFDIPYSTLGEKVRGRRPIKASSKFLLNPEEERRIVEWLKVYAERAMPRSLEDLRHKVKEVLDLRGASAKTKDGLPGKDWVLSFRRRFPELSMRTPQALGKERALVSPDAIQHWFSQMKQYLDSQDSSLLLSADRIFNADETGFALSPGTKKVLAPTGTKHVYSLSNNTRQQMTVLGCSSAAGQYVGPLIIFPRKRMPSSNPLEGFDNAFFQISPNGWMNTTIFKTWISDVFIPFVSNKRKPVVLFVDGHTSHNSDLSVLQMCNDNGVILYGFLPHASHIIQPLDLSVFGSMKAAWPGIVKAHMDKTGELASIGNFAKLLQQVWVKCATPESSLQGFMKSGIYPFNPDRPLSSGKMEASKSFQLQPQDDAHSSANNAVTAPAPPEHSGKASTSAPSPASDKWDTMSAFLHLADKLGIEKSANFLLAAKDNSPPEEEEEFRPFQKLLLDLGLSPSGTIPVAAPPVPSAPTSSRSLEDILLPPQLPKNKSGKTVKKSASLSWAFSSSEFQQVLKQKEERVEEAARAKEAKKLEREKAKEIREREKEEKKEKNRLERERKKKEKDMKILQKKQEKLLKDLEKKKQAATRDSSEDEDETEMVLESDTDSECAEMENLNACKKCGRENTQDDDEH